MLLPKRVKRKIEKKGVNSSEYLLRKLVSLQFPEDVTILDDKNAIVVFRDNGNSIIVHERLVEGQLIKISKRISFDYDYFEDKFSLINQLSLLKKANHREDYNLTYQYKKNSYIIDNGIWNTISFPNGNNDLLKKHKCAVGMLKISSDFEEGDKYSFISPITGEKVIETLEINDGNYFAILNFDGTIRGNTLFKGNSVAQAEDPIDLNDCGSLEDFIQFRKNLCNEMKQRNKNAYQEIIEKRNDGSISPYLDSEVMHVIKLKK